MRKETETEKFGFWLLWPVSEVNSKPANPFETKGNLASELAAVGVRKRELAEGKKPGSNSLWAVDILILHHPAKKII